jgi:hypothetical protein
MRTSIRATRGLGLVLGALLFLPPVFAAGAALIADGDFEANLNSGALRARGTTGGWYESRRDGKEGRLLLDLSTKPVAGNATRKAMIKASPARNTYLTQQLAQPQTGRFSLQWDILVKEILQPFNRSAFQMIGNNAVRGRGPNGAGKERFVFLGFENAGTPGKINLFAYEGGETDKWDTKRALFSGLSLGKWYTVRVDVDAAGQAYTVSVAGEPGAGVRVAAFHTKGVKAPTTLTHLSFASWNDGPGTFYVDNVR